MPYDPSGDWAFVLVEGSGILGALYAAFASRKERFAPPPGDFLWRCRLLGVPAGDAPAAAADAVASAAFAFASLPWEWPWE